MSSKKPVQLVIENEVSCHFLGLDREHLNLFVQAYASFAPNYFFHPLYKLGSWDGRVRFFTWNGQTYNTLIPEIVEALVKLNYKIEVHDHREAVVFQPDPVTEDYFSDVIDPETNQPIMLRDYQVNFANTLMDAGNGIGIAATSAGKAQPLHSKIMTPTGWKRMGEIVIGDEVIAADGSTTTVTGVFPQGKKAIYEVKFHDGTTTQCCKEHLWGVYAPVTHYTGKTSYTVMDTAAIMEFLDRKNSGIYTPGSISVPVAAPVDWINATTVPIPAYTMGALLGDGCMSQLNALMISSSDVEIITNITAELKPFGVSPKFRGGYDYGITKDSKRTVPPSPNPVVEILRELGLMGTHSGTKFIPEVYRTASLSDRQSIIRGLLDTDGTVDKRGNVSYTTSSRQLADDMWELIQSIGGICNITTRSPSYTSNVGETKKGQQSYTLHISHPNKASLFSLPRKVARCVDKKTANRPIRKRIVSITDMNIEEDAQCIMIDHPDRLYVTDDYIVTHNTFICGAMVEAYRRVGAKSIIIVPNADLVKQTRSELAFLNITTGEYSGKTKDINGRDIIVSTWQALKNNPTVLVDRNVVLVDETHGARGNVLQELLTKHCPNIPHRFGVTGTMPEHPSEAQSVRCVIGNVLATIGAAELIEKGVLATIDITVLQLIEDFKEQYKQYLETYSDAEPEVLVDYKTFKAKYFADYAGEKKYLSKSTERLNEIAATIDSRKNNGNVLALVQSVEMGKALAALVPNARFVYGNDDDKVRQEVYSLFTSHDNVVVFATYGIASTGLSIKRIHELFLIDIGKSFIRVIQSIGRGLRKAPDKQHINVWDVCSDLTYGKKHLTKRKAMYKKAGYPHRVKKVDYKKVPQYDDANAAQVDL